MVTEYLLDMQPGLWKVIAATASGSTDRFIHDPMGIAQHEDNSGDWYWMAKDGLGTVRGVYDDTLTEAYAADRDPYGDLITATGSNPTPFEYTGEPEDANGLLHLRARYYDPNLAVFNSLDPVETANRYAYVEGNPINFTDPSGNVIYACFSSDGRFGGFGTIYDYEFATFPQVVGIKLPGKEMVWRPGTEPVYKKMLQQNCEPKEESFGFSESAILGSAGLKLTTCNSTLSWRPYFGSVAQAIRDVEAKVGNFHDVFGGLEFRLHANGTGDAAYTESSTLVHWYNDVFKGEGVDLRYSPAQNRTWNIVHELGHVLDNRTDTSLRKDAQDINRNNLLAAAEHASDTMEPQNNFNSVEENVANLFQFWIYGRIDAPDEIGDAARAFAEGGIIVRLGSKDEYPFTYVGVNPPPAIISVAKGLAATNSGYRLSVTEGFEHWLSVARSKSYSSI